MLTSQQLDRQEQTSVKFQLILRFSFMKMHLKCIWKQCLQNDTNLLNMLRDGQIKDSVITNLLSFRNYATP